MKENICISLDEAREEIKKRWNDVELKSRIGDELGNKFMEQFKNIPRSVVFRQICPADNGFEFFYYSAKYMNTEPLVIEYLDDIFVHFNEEKKGLGRLRVKLEDGTPAMVDIMNFHENEKKKLGDCVLKTGEKLVDFHHNLFKILNHDIEIADNSKWFHDIGKASEYYYYFLLHFIAHGILFENLTEGDEGQRGFADDIMMPFILRIKEKFGLYPLIVRSYPDGQDSKEDFFWWCYPPLQNRYIIKYVKEQNFPLKAVNIKL